MKEYGLGHRLLEGRPTQVPSILIKEVKKTVKLSNRL